MNDYQTLMAFIASQVPAVAPAPGESYRDLLGYFTEKLDNASNDRDDVKEMASRALQVAGLDTNRKSGALSALNQPARAHDRACGATLLAMSIIRDTSDADLRTNLARLRKMQTPMVVAELLSILKKGDTLRSTRHARLELKNFNSAGTRSALWKHEIEDAYGRAHDLLLRCEMQFLISRGNTLGGSIATAFNDYFGSPAAVIDTSTIPFGAGGAKPTWTTASQTRLEVVREVLRRVCRNFVRQEIRIYFGGRSIDAGTFAYVSGTTNPTKIHVGGQFFTKVKEGLASEAGTIVHECTHTFARTQDHAYRSDPCKQLALNNPAKALSNADSYKFFVEAAFR
jgi:hypothetical protein